MNEFMTAINLIAETKGIKKEDLLHYLEEALKKGYKTKNKREKANVYDYLEVVFNDKKDDLRMYEKLKVVDHLGQTAEEEAEKAAETEPAPGERRNNKAPQHQGEITLEEARKIDSTVNVGDVIKVEVTMNDFGRIAAQNVKQNFIQMVNEAERGVIREANTNRVGHIISGPIQRIEGKNVYINLGKIEAKLTEYEQIPGEVYSMNQFVKAYVTDVKDDGKNGPVLMVSRTRPHFVAKLFEEEVPEIHNEVVIIKAIAREAGSRSKMAVYSIDPMVDPQGACIGQNGGRVNAVVNELNGEKIDIVVWNKKPEEFIKSALSPAEVISVEILNDGSEETKPAADGEKPRKMKMARVVVKDDQLSLAIGKEGQNARLAAKLTEFKIDIKSESQMAQLEAESAEEDFDYDFDFEFEDDMDGDSGDFEFEFEDDGEDA